MPEVDKIVRTPVEQTLMDEIAALSMRLNAAEGELLAERFRDVPRRAEGELVIVPRKLFGEIKWWPARVAWVHFSFSEGSMPDGTPWQNRTVSYAVQYQTRDGKGYADDTHGYYASEVHDAPAAEEATA